MLRCFALGGALRLSSERAAGRERSVSVRELTGFGEQRRTRDVRHRLVALEVSVRG